ncbi:MAG: tyrosine-type recombinase/integrase [Vicingaceae bacterium]|nr:tyrosine-type recombinase/integrase [Vicingaceae bacterium]
MMNLELRTNKYGLKVYCMDCDMSFTVNTINSCKHGGEKQSYKSIVYKPGIKKSISKKHETRSYDEALVIAIKFKADVKTGVIDNLVVEPSEGLDPQQLSVVEAAEKFMQYKYGLGEFSHITCNLSENYLDSIQFYLQQFMDILTKNRCNIETMPISKIIGIHVSFWEKEIKSHYSKGSWNAPLTIMRLWVEFVKERMKVDMVNFFKDIPLVQVENNVRAITCEEFTGVCKAVGTTSPYQYLNGETTKRKNRYKPYLVDAFKLALQTGLRREEYLTLEWKDVVRVGKSDEFMIITDNIKVQRITKKKYKKKHIPVHEELAILLKELGWEKFAGKDQFIIQPNRTAIVNTMMKDLTRGFSHYYKQAFPGVEHLTLGALRKTYITYLSMEVGDDIIEFTSHSGIEILEDYYYDKKILAKGLKMKIFS